MWGIAATWEFSLEPVRLGAGMLEKGADPADALVEAIERIELDENIDCVGVGGWPNLRGMIELDSGMMDGDTYAIGAVAGLRDYANAIRLSRYIMENSPYQFFVAEGAMELASQMGLQRRSLLTAHAIEKWKSHLPASKPCGHDTVGMITLSNGHMFAGTSTSGIGMKTPGRVGDSPLPSSGYYCNSAVGGAAATGLGEDIMKAPTCFLCVEYMAQGMTPTEAAEAAVKRTHGILAAKGQNPGNIALVCMNKEGESGGAANHEGFFFCCANADNPPRLRAVSPCCQRRSTNTKEERINNLRPIQ